jgi:hypothetical protein
MSESTLTVRKAIRIIAVTWILSLVTTLAIVYLVPIVLRPTWHKVAMFSGTFEGFDSERTDDFHIPSDHWKVHWEVDCEVPPPEDVEFRLSGLVGGHWWGGFRLRKVWLEDFRRATQQGVEWWGHVSGIEYVTESGYFYLIISGVSVDWEVTVEAYY